GLGHAVTGDHVSNRVFFGTVGSILGILQNFAYALSQLADFTDFVRLIGVKMSADDSFLRMPKTECLGNGNYLVDFVYVQVSTRSIVVFEKWHDSLVPARQHSGLPGICRVKIYSRFCA